MGIFIGDKVFKTHTNSQSIVSISRQLIDNKLKDGTINENTYNRNLQSIQSYSSLKFATIPIRNVTREEIEDFLESQRNKANSTIAKEFRIIKNAFDYAEYKKLIKTNFFYRI